MLHTIENQWLTAVINEKGAELTSLTNKADGYNAMWEGDPAVWSGHSPLLFPVVGKLLGDRYTYRGEAYSMRKHGFAGKETFRVAQKDDVSLTLMFDDAAKYFDSYPFTYSLQVRFALEENALTVTHTVVNNGQNCMYFSLGAHPAIACKDGYLQFQQQETVSAHQFGPDMVIRDEKTPFLSGSARYELQPHTFDHDAYVLEGLKSEYVDVHSEASEHVIRVTFGGAPYVGIWAKPGANYVCIEPWLGLDDDHHQTGEIERKKGIVALESGEKRDFSIRIICD